MRYAVSVYGDSVIQINIWLLRLKKGIYYQDEVQMEVHVCCGFCERMFSSIFFLTAKKYTKESCHWYMIYTGIKQKLART